MEMETVNKLLTEVALVHQPEQVNKKKALQNIALALMHMAKSIDEIQKEQTRARRKLEG